VSGENYNRMDATSNRNLNGNLIWGSTLLAVILFITLPDTRDLYKELNVMHPYIMGFIKFMLLATMGELLTIRIVKYKWEKPNGILARALIWGFIGVVIVLVFSIFPKGTMATLFDGSGIDITSNLWGKLLFAFTTSVIMNVIFAPTMMGFHRITDTIIDIYYKNNKMPTVSEAVKEIDWSSFVSFVLLKTIPLFWIPAHTITFLVSSEYRVVLAAMLSIVLGGILAFAKKKDQPKIEVKRTEIKKEVI
jgi:hypothetical protein